MMDLSIVPDAWAAIMWKACWQGSLVVLAVWLICRLMPSMPARSRCWLWRLTMLKFVIVLSLPTLFSLPLLPAPAAVMPEYESQVSSAPLGMPSMPIASRLPDRSEPIELPRFQTVLFFVWIIGATWCVARLAAAGHDVIRLRKRCRATDLASAVEQLRSQTALYGLRAPPALLETDGDGSPMLIGVFRPVIVIPNGTLRQLGPAELAMVLGHELAHLRRGDLLWSLAAAGVRALFFFHPLVWLGQRRLTLAQEIAADELAIRQQHFDSLSYGKLLVSVISKIGPGRLIPRMSLGTAGSVQSLTWRLVAMTSIGRASRRVIISSGILLAALVLLGILPWQLIAAEPKEGDEQQRNASSMAGAIPPAPPATVPLTLREDQRLASIAVWEVKKGQTKVLLSRPTMLLLLGQEAKVEEQSASLRLEVTIHSQPDINKVVRHHIDFKLVRDPLGKSPVTIMAPTLSVSDNTKGMISGTIDDGSELGIEATVEDRVGVERHRVAGVKAVEDKNSQSKNSLPVYRIEPPDVIKIEMLKLIPGSQPITGQYLVGPDGTVNLRRYGVVHIAGKTVTEARIAVQDHLKQHLDSPDLSVDVVAYNSKVYYIITHGTGSGDSVRRMPITGNECVLDALAQVSGLSQLSGKKIWIDRLDDDGRKKKILPIDWDAIATGAQTATNYQMWPGDRLHIESDPPNPTKVKQAAPANNAPRGYYGVE